MLPLPERSPFRQERKRARREKESLQYLKKLRESFSPAVPEASAGRGKSAFGRDAAPSEGMEISRAIMPFPSAESAGA